MVEAIIERGHSSANILKTIAFGLTLGVLTAAIVIAIELMWQAFASSAAWSFDAFVVQSILVFLIIAFVSGAMYAIVMRIITDLRHLLIGDLVAGAAMGATVYFVMLFSTMEYAETMINFGFTGAHETGLGYIVPTFLGPFLFLTVIGAIATSMGAITCRSAIIKRKPTGNDLKNAALGMMGLLVLIMVAPPLAAMVLQAV